ncbi:hypothetical protein NAI62_12680, partial [Francisella tularensis subsp. holarctica]|nr:hypothetical protein [Francisella tularensis subsp. holarctica]
VMFAGIDVIGDKLTEFNITSPTGIQEIYKATKIHAASLLMQAVEKKINKMRQEHENGEYIKLSNFICRSTAIYTRW